MSEPIAAQPQKQPETTPTQRPPQRHRGGRPRNQGTLLDRAERRSQKLLARSSDAIARYIDRESQALGKGLDQEGQPIDTHDAARTSAAIRNLGAFLAQLGKINAIHKQGKDQNPSLVHERLAALAAAKSRNREIAPPETPTDLGATG